MDPIQLAPILDNDVALDSTPQETDQELLERILDGDGAAFSALVEKYHPKIFRLVRGIIGDWHISEDVCQEVLTIIYRKLSSFRHRSQFSTWVYRVSVNAALKARKRKARFEAENLDGTHGLTSPGDRRGPELEGNEVVEKLLLPLPENLRVAVVLREQGGLSYAEIADILGCSRGAVEQRLHRAMVLLRSIWKDLGKEWKGQKK